ncbi:hypothetical protein Fmac_008799 [Flemingia macrophylla]|uniref:glucan endo-1,3-beta-D-glucosidase n=1 Tax=Flemingia macrophylla TaxID=520843 RepID=A0ABD1MYI2_9FABA
MEYHPSCSGSSSSHSKHHTLASQHSLDSVPSLNTTSQSHHQAYHHCLTTFKGHTSYISSLTLSGKFLYTGSSDRQILSWNRSQLQKSTAAVSAGNGAVKSLVIHSNKLFSAHQDHKIRVWKIADNNDNNNKHDHLKYTHVATLPTLGDRASKVLIPKNHVQIRRHKKRTWVHHVDTVSALALSKDGTLLYSVSWDRTIKIWRTKDFTCLESLAGAHADAINAIAVSYDGRVYTGSADNTIKVWTKPEGEKKHILVETLERHNSGVNALALSSDQTVLYSGACDRSVLVWERDESDDGNLAVVGALRGHTKSILCLAVAADLLCSGSADKTIRIWRGFNAEYSCLAVLEGHTGSVKCITAVVDHCNPSHSEASFLVYSGGLDCDIKIIVSTSSFSSSPSPPLSPPSSARFVTPPPPPPPTPPSSASSSSSSTTPTPPSSSTFTPTTSTASTRDPPRHHPLPGPPFNFHNDFTTDVRYRNLFDFMVDVVISTLVVVGYETVPMVVMETGWPSASSAANEFEANAGYAEIYLQGLVKH